MSAEGRLWSERGAALLDAAAADGDDPVMAEWRKLVQAEKSSRNATVARPPPSVVDRDATNARYASLEREAQKLAARMKVPTSPATMALLESKKFTVEAEMKMLSRMRAVAP